MNCPKTIIRAVLLVLVLSGVVGGQLPVRSASGDEGSAAGVFLRMDPTASSSGFGSAYTARPDGVASAFYNPAGLGVLRSSEALFTNMDFIAGIGYNHTGIVIASESLSGGMGLSVTSLDYGSQDRTQINNENPIIDLGSFSAEDKAFSLSYGRKISNRLLGGLTTKWVESSLASEDASTLTADLGLMYAVPSTNLNAGISARNLVGDLQFQREADPLPRTLDVGGHYSLSLDGSNRYRLNLGTSYVHLSDGDPYLKAGSELVVSEVFSLRFGYHGSQEAGDGWTLGGGLGYEDFSVDYAYVPRGVLGNHQRLSLKYEWGGAPKVESSSNEPQSERKVSESQQKITEDQSKIRLKNATFAPDTAVVGEPVDVRVTFANQGKRPGDTKVTVNVNGETFAGKDIRIEPGEKTVQEFELVFQKKGTYDLSINNEFQKDLIVQSKPKSRITLDGIDLVPDTPVVGDSINAEVALLNRGGIDGDTELRVDVNGESYVQEKVTVPSGDKIDFEMKLLLKKSGTHVITVNDTLEEKITVQTAQERLKQMNREIQNRLANKDREGLREITSKILFDAGSTQSLEERQRVIDQTAEVLKKYPERYVVISGHTGDLPVSDPIDDGIETNRELSRVRSVRVSEILAEQHGIDAGRISVAWYAEQEPLVPNTSPSNRQRNRRVEVYLLPPDEIVEDHNDLESLRPLIDQVQ